MSGRPSMAVVSVVVAVSVICLDTLKRQLWEKLGPLHKGDCHCHGFRMCCSRSYAGQTFEVGRSNDTVEADNANSQSQLEVAIMGLCAPKAERAFLAFQTGSRVACSGFLVASSDSYPTVNQAVFLPLPSSTSASNSANDLIAYLYSRSGLGDHLMAMARISLNAVVRGGMFQEVHTSFSNIDGKQVGQMRLVIRRGIPRRDLISFPPLLGDTPMEAQAEEAKGKKASPTVDMPIVVYSAGMKPALAVLDTEQVGEAKPAVEVVTSAQSAKSQ